MSKSQKPKPTPIPVEDFDMCVVDNPYRGQHPGAPDTSCLLIIRAHTPARTLLLTKVVGITRQAQLRFGREGVHLLETTAGMEELLGEYFELSWEQALRRAGFKPDSDPFPGLVH